MSSNSPNTKFVPFWQETALELALTIVFLQEASEVLEYAFTDVCSGLQRASLTEEFYGPEYAIIKVQILLNQFIINLCAVMMYQNLPE